MSKNIKHSRQAPAPLPAPFGMPEKQGMYDPRNEKDACGVGYVVSIDGNASNKV